MRIRVIENTPDLPSNFALVKGSSYEEGVSNMVKAVRDEGANLAIWDGAADMIPEDLKNSVFNLRENARIKTLVATQFRNAVLGIRFKPAHRQEIWTENLTNHFDDLARRFSNQHAETIERLKRERYKLVEALDHSFRLKSVQVEDRFVKRREEQGYHFDWFDKGKFQILQTQAGNATYFVSDADRPFFKEPYAPRHNTSVWCDEPEKVEWLWMPKLWAMALQGQNLGFPKSVIHSFPFIIGNESIKPTDCNCVGRDEKRPDRVLSVTGFSIA